MGMIQGGTKDKCEPAPEAPTVRQRLVDKCAESKKHLERYEMLLRLLPEDLLRMKIDELERIFFGFL